MFQQSVWIEIKCPKLNLTPEVKCPSFELMSSNILQIIKSDLLSHITPSQSVFQNQSNLKDTLEVKLFLFQLINEELIYSNNIQLAETTLRLLELLKLNSWQLSVRHLSSKQH